MQNVEAVDVLVKLGLTELQAKTYLTLTQLKTAEVKKIAAQSNIARQDIYRIMPVLEELGLVEKIIATPILYKAIPLSEGTLMLFQRRKEEEAKLKSSLKLLVDNREENSKMAPQEENLEFVITSERKRFVRRLEKSISKAARCEMICPGEAFGFVIFNFYESLISALSEGRKVRVITQKTNMNLDITRKLGNLCDSLNFEIKFVTSPIDLGMIILDKEVNICISDWKEVPSLWTNNRQILKLAQSVFEKEWSAHNGFQQQIVEKQVNIVETNTE
ncbi:MAG: TrmB family transcriptional regulator [Candidatus Bathyarchaeia archaeon]